MKAFLAELKRRNVLRAALLYVGASWALAQGISELSGAIGLPDWSARAFIIASAVGFPLWVLFAWFYEFTPRGFRRESEVPAGESIARQTGRRLDYWIIGVLSLAVVLLLTDRLLPRDQASTGADGASNSIAVLPLVNASGDSADDYFSDGLSEELISGLTKIEALRVIGRTSTFEFKGSQDSRADIAGRLGVAHLLEGTVRRDGDRVRIMVELIRPEDGTSLWSRTYNRELKDIFAVQAEIARSVAAALEVKLGGDAVDHERPPNDNLAAYQAVLRGNSQRLLATEQGMTEAVDLYREAVRLEPDYAVAHVNLALALFNLATRRSGTPDAAQMHAQARSAAERAMALAPGYHGSHRLRGYILQRLDGDLEGAGEAFRHALALAPNEGANAWALAGYLMQQARWGEAVALMEDARARDPLRVEWPLQLSVALERAGRPEASFDALRQALAIAPHRIDVVVTAAGALRMVGRYTEAEALLRRAITAHPDEAGLQVELAWVLDGQNRSEEAWRAFDQALALKPDNGNVHGELAHLQLQHGLSHTAVEHARLAIRANPRNLYWRRVLGYALMAQGRLDEADRELREAIRLNPEHPFVHAALADVAAMRGDIDTARASAQAETDPDVRLYAQALVGALEGTPAFEAAMRRLREGCTGRPADCLQMTASLYGFARQPEAMFDVLAEAEVDPAYRPDLGDPYFAPYWHDPRFIALLDRYGMSPPSPVSRSPSPH